MLSVWNDPTGQTEMLVLKRICDVKKQRIHMFVVLKFFGAVIHIQDGVRTDTGPVDQCKDFFRCDPDRRGERGGSSENMVVFQIMSKN